MRKIRTVYMLEDKLTITVIFDSDQTRRWLEVSHLGQMVPINCKVREKKTFY